LVENKKSSLERIRKMSTSQACAYATLLLHSSDLQVTAQAITDLAAASGVKVPKYQAETFAKSYDRDTFSKLVSALTTPGAGASSGAPAQSTGGSEKKTEAKVEAKVEEKAGSESAGGFGDMFGGEEED
jgi:ribosomal protein L12E/L44/L45/RPP1/RPP2